MINSLITITELERRTDVFAKILPGNPVDNADCSKTDISRVMLKAIARNKIYDPAIQTDKHDIQHELRRQFYNDITVAARAKSAELRRDRELLKLRTR